MQVLLNFLEPPLYPFQTAGFNGYQDTQSIKTKFASRITYADEKGYSVTPAINYHKLTTVASKYRFRYDKTFKRCSTVCVGCSMWSMFVRI